MILTDVDLVNIHVKITVILDFIITYSETPGTVITVILVVTFSNSKLDRIYFLVSRITSKQK